MKSKGKKGILPKETLQRVEKKAVANVLERELEVLIQAEARQLVIEELRTSRSAIQNQIRALVPSMIQEHLKDAVREQVNNIDDYDIRDTISGVVDDESDKVMKSLDVRSLVQEKIRERLPTMVSDLVSDLTLSY